MRPPLHRVVSAALLGLLAGAPAAQAGPFPYTTAQHVLPSGLRLVFVPMDSPGLTAYYTAVRTGSRNEVERGLTGFAHFFEHMMFRGTRRNPSFDARMAEFGWHSNAFTSDDQTVYTDFGPSDRLGDVIALEADRFQNLEYAEAAFRTEALAVLGEYNKSAAAPWMRLEETLVGTAFTTHTYQHTTMGYLADIRAMPEKYADSLRFHARHYRPDNCIVVVAGDFDAPAILSRIETEYAGFAGHADAPPVPAEPPQTAPRRAEVVWPSATLPRMIVAHKVPPATDRRAAAAAAVLYAYLFGETGTLHKALVLDRQIAEPFNEWSSSHRDPGLWAILATAKDPADLPAIEAAIAAAFDEVRAGRVDAEQIARIQENQRNGLLLGLDDPEKVAERLSWEISVTGDLDAVDRSLSAMAALTPEDVSRFVREWIVPAGQTVVTLRAEPKESQK